MGRLSDQVVARLRRAIVHEEYAPGSRMPTAEALSDSLEVSLSVVRDALRTLSSMGLVEVRQGHGIFVSVPRDDIVTTALTLRMQRSGVTIGEVLAARITLESTLAAEAAHVCDDEALRMMRGHLRRFEDGVRAKDWPTAHDQHLQFHLSIIKALRLPALELLIEPLQELIIVSSIPRTRRAESSGASDRTTRSSRHWRPGIPRPREPRCVNTSDTRTRSRTSATERRSSATPGPRWRSAPSQATNCPPDKPRTNGGDEASFITA